MQSQAMSPTACYDDSLASKRAVTCKSSRISQNTSPVISTQNTTFPRLPIFRCLSSLLLHVECLSSDDSTGVTPHTVRHFHQEVNPENHGPPWLGRGLTETGTNLVFRFLAELWERCWCLASLVCWNSSPWFVTNVHWSSSLIY